jgi:hypothetical protein
VKLVVSTLLYAFWRALRPVKTIFFYGTSQQQQCDNDHELGCELMKRVAAALINNLHANQQRVMECTDVNNLPEQETTR